MLAIADKRPRADLRETVQTHGINLIITLGDLTREDILPLAEVADIPKIGVYGNHDSGTYMPELKIWNLHLQTAELDGIIFGGFQGCVRYKENPEAIMYTQAEAIHMMKNFPAVDVFISHCPPRGIHDEEEVAHQGFDALRDYLDRVSPRMWLHGHTYPSEAERITQYHQTRIEYVQGYAIITL